MAVSLSLVAAGPRMKPPKIVVYGVGGIGKTYTSVSSEGWLALRRKLLVIARKPGKVSVEIKELRILQRGGS